MSEERSVRPMRQVGLLGPLILIFLGVIFLTNTLGYLGWGIWADMWKLWPLILVLIGLDLLTGRRWLRITVPDYEGPHRNGRVTGAVVLILIGLLFLAGNTGLVGWSVWSALWRLWPVLLIAIGLDHLLGRTLPFGRYLVAALVVALIGVSVWALGTGVEPGQALASDSVSQALGGATRAEVQLRPAVGMLRVSGGAASGQLIEGVVDRGGGARVVSDFSVSGDTARYSLEARDVPNFAFFPGPRDLTWDLHLSEQAPLSLDIRTGVGQANLDLSRLQLTNLTVNTGVGQTTLTLPQRGQFRASIRGGVGETTVRVPRGLGVRLQLRTGIGDAQVPAGYSMQGGAYVSPGYAAGAGRVDLEIHGGIGQIRVVEGL